MSDNKILRVHDAKILYSNIRDKIRTANQKLTTKIDDASVEDGYLVLKSDGVEVKRLTGFGGSGGSGGGGIANNAVLTITNMSGWTEKILAQGSTIKLSIFWSSLENGNSTGAGTATLYVNNVAKITGATIAQGIYAPDISSYVSLGVNSIRVIITDSYGNSAQQNYTITIAAYKVTANDFSTASAFSSDIRFTYSITGEGDKYMHFILDGVDLTSESPVVISSKSTTQTYIIPKQNHGLHTLSVYFTVELNGDTITSNTLSYNIMCTGDSTDPIISASTDITEANQYDTVTLTYQVYDPKTSNATVSIYTSEDGSTFTLGTSSTTIASGSYYTWTFKINNGNPDGSTDVYELLFKIECRNISTILSVSVTPSQRNIEAVTSNLQLYLTSAGRSNNETSDSISKWHSDAGNIDAILTGFNWSSNGWISDSSTNNYPALRISNGAKVEIPYKPFITPDDTNEDIINTGRTFEFEFSTSSVNSYDDVIISCWDDSINTNIGFKITAQQATFKSSTRTIYTQYKEEEHIRVSFVVTPGNNPTSDKLVYIYVNGIISGIERYPDSEIFNQSSPRNITIGSDNTTIDLYNIRIYGVALSRSQVVDNWIADMQDSNAMIIYYDKNNIFFDSTSDNPDINPEALDEELPYLILDVANDMDSVGNPIVDESTGKPAGYLPQAKGDKKLINGRFVDKSNPKRSFTFTKAQIDVQGTSSAGYPRKNYKIKFKNFVPTTTDSTYFSSKSDDGTYYKKYKMHSNSIGAKTFTFKADYASSEGANNVELVRYYNDIVKSVHLTLPQQKELESLAEERGVTVDQISTTDISTRVGIDGFAIAVFGLDVDGNTYFIGKYNFNDDKGSTDVYGLSSHGEEYDDDFNKLHDGVPDESWETGDNSATYTRWIDYPTGTKEDIVKAWLGDPYNLKDGELDGIYEVRYPDTWQDALADEKMFDPIQIDRFLELHKWVASTDTHTYSVTSYPHGIKQTYVKTAEYLPTAPTITAGETDVSSYYIKNGDTYTLASGTAEEGVDYYILTGEKFDSPKTLKATYELIDASEIVIDTHDSSHNSIVAGFYTYDESSDSYTRIDPIYDQNDIIGPLAEENVDYYRLISKLYYYDNKEYRLDKFKAEFEDYFYLDDAIFYYIFTEAFLMIDSRVKNSFPTYFAKVEKTVSPNPIYEKTDDSVVKNGTDYYYRLPVYTQVVSSSLVDVGSDVSQYYKNTASDEEEPNYVQCSEEDTAIIGVDYYQFDSSTNEYTLVESGITYPTDASKLYTLVDGSYVKSENPINVTLTYYTMSETGTMTLDSTLNTGDELSGHTYYTAENDYIYTDTKEGRWGWLPYDMDTALGINNEGKLVFGYNLEDTDIIDGDGNIVGYGSLETKEEDFADGGAASGSTEYDNSAYVEESTTSSHNVFNGQDAVIWNNLRECYKSEIAKQYSTLRTGAFNYNTIESRFEAHQSVWPAKLWNEDAYFKYVKPLISPETSPDGTVNESKNYLEMCLGSKEQQRKWWLYNRFKYLDSKYTTGDSSKKYIYFRSYNIGTGKVSIIPYISMYVRMRIGKAINVLYRGTQDEETLIDVASLDRSFSPNDTETYIYSADQIKEIKGLSEFCLDSLDISSATRLLHLNLDGFHNVWNAGSETYTQENSNGNLMKLDLSNNTMLQTVSVKNCINLEGDPGLQYCYNLTDVNFLGCTKLSGMTLPNGGVLTNVYLPSEKLTNLYLENQLSLQNIHVMKQVTSATDSNIYYTLASNEDTVDSTYYDDVTKLKYIDDFSNLIQFVWVNVNPDISDRMFEILNELSNSCRINLNGFTNVLNTTEELESFIDKIRSFGYLKKSGDRYFAANEPQIIGTVSADWDSDNPLEVTYEYVSDIQTTVYTDESRTKLEKYGLKDLTFDYPIRKTVKFYNGEDLLDTQTVTTRGFIGGSVTYSSEMPTKTDIEPSYNSDTREWTTGIHYVFAGWSTSPDSTTAEWKFNDTDNWRDLDGIVDPTQTLDGITASISVYAIFLKVDYYGVEVYDYKGTTSIDTLTVIGSGYIELPDQGSVTLDSQTVDFAGWGTQAYGGEDLSYEKLEGKQKIYIDQNRVIYAIMNWPISSIEVTTPPTKTNYYIGEVFDPTGVIVKAEKRIINSNGEEEVTEPLIVSTYDYSPRTALTADTRIITFSLDGKYYYQNIGIAQSISVSDDDIEKSLFNVGESWDPTGLKITVTYRVGNADSSTEEISIDSKNKADSLFTVTMESLNDVFVKPSELGFTESGKQLLTIKMIKQDLRSTVHASVLPNINSVLEENSWKDIAVWAETGRGASTWNIGDEKSITIPEGNYQYITSGTVNFRILGFDHNTEIETNGESTITFGLSTKSINGTNVDFVYPSIEAINRDEFRSHTNTGDSVFSWHFGSALNDACIEFYNALPSEVKDVIRPTIKSQADAEENMVELCYNYFFDAYAEGEGDNRAVYVDSGTVYLGSDIIKSKELKPDYDEDGNMVNCPVFVPNMMEIFGYSDLVSDLGEASWNRKFTADESVSSKQFSYYQDYKDTSGNVTQVNNYVTNANGPINYIAYKYQNSSSGPTLTSYWTRSILAYKYARSSHTYSMYGTFCPVGSINDNNTRLYANMEYYLYGTVSNSKTLKGFLPCFVI